MKKGFTLVELMVAVLAFSLAIVEISSVFLSGLRSQRQSLGYQRLLDQTSYAYEFMSRSLRMARKEGTDVLGNCLSENGLNYELVDGGTGIRFINHLEEDDCQKFFLEDGQLKYQRKILTTDPETYALTSENLEVTRLTFLLEGERQVQGEDLDNYQPRVVFSMDVKWEGPKSGEQITSRIQSMVSQRTLDVVY